MAALNTGTQAPDFRLPLVGGGEFSLKESLAKSAVVLAFFKISCPVCQYALPIVERIHRAYPNAKIYGVSQNSAHDTERFCREFDVTFPILLDDPKTYTASNAYGLTNVPTIFYIAPDGEIEVSSVGWSRKEVEEIATRLATVQKAPPASLFHAGEQVADFRSG